MCINDGVCNTSATAAMEGSVSFKDPCASSVLNYTVLANAPFHTHWHQWKAMQFVSLQLLHAVMMVNNYQAEVCAAR